MRANPNHGAVRSHLQQVAQLTGWDLIEQPTEGSNEYISSELAMLPTLDHPIEQALKTGHIMQLPYGHNTARSASRRRHCQDQGVRQPARDQEIE